MKKKKIVFIINSITITRCLKRISEFIENGYEVDVYGLKRGDEVYALPSGFSITIVGSLKRGLPYFTRLRLIYKSIKKIFKQYKKQDVIFYYFFFDVAFTARLLCRRPFIYEESDMPYTSIPNKMVRLLFGEIDKRMIKKSFLTVMTSEGFIDYHFGDNRPANIVVVPNRVNPALLNLSYSRKEIETNHLSFSFVGGFRYTSVLNFAEVIGVHFPQHEFHVYGVILENEYALMSLCKEHANIHFHGKFRNPDDLPSIYENTDVVLAAYDATYINAQYAEPNKMYEAIFFRTPIIVSNNTFLAKKVERLGIGFTINALDKKDIIDFINGLTKECLTEKIQALDSIPQEDATNKNPQLFQYFQNMLC